MIYNILTVFALICLSIQVIKSQKIVSEFSIIDSPVVDLVWCNKNEDKIVIALSENGIVYRSNDKGQKWEKINNQLHQSAQEVQSVQSDKYEEHEILELISNQHDKNEIIFIGKKHINWITSDCGTTLRAMNHGRQVNEFQFHPTERKWLLASAWTICEDFVHTECKKYKELFFSNDLGMSWQSLAKYVYQFGWGRINERVRMPKERIIVAYDPKGFGNQTKVRWKESIRISYTDNFFETTEPLVIHGNRFLLTEKYFFVARALTDDSGELLVSLMPLQNSNNNKNRDLSNNNNNNNNNNLNIKSIKNQNVNDGKGNNNNNNSNNNYNQYKNKLTQQQLQRHQDLNFSSIHIPDVQNLDHHAYTVLDSSGHQIFLHINHFGPNSRYGSIFISDHAGSKFSLSLSNHVRTTDGQTDFEKLQGMEGIIIANVYDSEAVNNFVMQSNQQEAMNIVIDYEKHGVDKDASFSSVKKGLDQMDNNKKTYISFDNGAIWKLIQAPLTHSNGTKSNCHIVNDCSLHLNSQSNGHQFGPVYSTKNSIGLIIGTGNIGQHLSSKADRINTYISNDAGRTWREIKKGSHIYDVGDHGGIIVIASDQQATDTIFYSLDEGLTWEPHKFSKEPVEVTNIIIEPSNTGTDFLIIGKKKKALQGQGIISSIDFSKIHSSVCQGASDAGSPQSDFEQWTPKQGNEDSYCLLGRRVIYIKKKPDRKCFNGEQFERRFIVQNCHCTESDWECDYGFVRTSSGPCIRSDGQDIKFEPPESCLSSYYVSLGYRKVAGDTCIMGVQHEPIKLQCPGMNPQYVVLSLVALILFLLLLLVNRKNFSNLNGVIINSICYLFCCCYNNNSNQSDDNQQQTKNQGQSQRDRKNNGFGKYYSGFGKFFSKKQEEEYYDKGYQTLGDQSDTLFDEDSTFNLESLKKRFNNYEY